MRAVRHFLLAIALAWLGGAVQAAAPPSPPAYEATISAARSVMMTDPAAALRQARRAKEIAAAMPASVQAETARARAEWLEGEALSRLDRPEQALSVLEHALATVSRTAPRDPLRGDVLLSRGWVVETRGGVAAAFADFQQAFGIYRAAGDARGQAKALQNIAGIYQDAGDHARAERYYAQAAEVYQGDAAFTLAAHNNVGESLRLLGRYADAEREYRTALAAARTLGSPLLEANILTNLASTSLQRDDAAGATALAQRALRLADGAGAADERPFVWGVLAQIAAARGNTQEAVQFITRTFEGVDLRQSSLRYRDFHKLAADLYARAGRPELALAHLNAWKRLDDDVRAVAASTNAALMAARFDFSTQNLRIAQLQANRAKLHETVLAIVVAAVTLISALLLFGVISLRRSRNSIRATNRQLTKALQAKSDFLAMTSHEIRTPLNGILGMTQVLLADRKLGEPLRAKIQTVHGAGEAMRALVDDILDLSKMETGKLAINRQPVRARQLIGSVVKLWVDKAHAKGLGLTLDLGDCPELIEEDADRLRQILFNLLSNAVKFTDRGRVTVNVAAVGDALEVRVIDTGIGIAPEHHALIFEKFQQADGSISRRFAGTGLGLAICRNLAEAMGGEIGVASELGHGSTFTLRLPLRRLAVPEPVAPAVRAATPTVLAEDRVLLLEPNPLTQRIIAKGLRDHVGSVEPVADAAALYAALEAGGARHVIFQASAVAGADAPPDAISDLASAIARAGARGIILVGADDKVDEADLEAQGMKTLRKPVGAGDLLAALHGDRNTEGSSPAARSASLAPAA